MKCRTLVPGRLHSPSAPTHHPPHRKCFNDSCSASWYAISRLGASELERIEQYRKIALNDSNPSVARPTTGPNQMISSRICGRRWYFAFAEILDGSIRAAMSRTLAAATSTSDYKQLDLIQTSRLVCWSTHQVFVEMSDFGIVEESGQFTYCPCEGKPKIIDQTMDVKDIDLR